MYIENDSNAIIAEEVNTIIKLNAIHKFYTSLQYSSARTFTQEVLIKSNNLKMF